MITKELKVWIGGPRGVPPVVRVSQYDTAWRFVFTVYDGAKLWTIPTGAAVVMEGRKADGTVIAYAGTVENGTAIVECGEQMTSARGDVTCELRFADGSGAIVGTANFVLKVEAAPLAGYIASGDDFSAMEQLVNKALAAAGETGSTNEVLKNLTALIADLRGAVGAPQVAETAEEMTDRASIYVYTGSETGYTAGHWYYYKSSTGAWTDGGVYNATAFKTDTTLSTSGAAADAKVAGDEIEGLKSALSEQIKEQLDLIGDIEETAFTWAYGAFNPNGSLNESDNHYRARVENFINVSDIDAMLIPDTEQYDFSVQQYNADKVFAGAVGWITDNRPFLYVKPTGVTFVRLGAKLKSGYEITDTELVRLDVLKFLQIILDYHEQINVLQSIYKNFVKETNKRIEKRICGSLRDIAWEQGTITDGVNRDSEYRARVQGYIPVNKGDKLVLDTRDGKYNFAYTLYGTNYLYKDTVGWVSTDTTYIVPANVAYLRIHVKAVPDVVFSEDEINKLKGLVFIVNTSYSATQIINKKPRYIRAYDPLVGQDCTMVKGKLWIFYDSDINNKIYKLDLASESATDSETQNFGHCNSVDYNPNNDSLLIYKTSASNDPQAIIYKNPSEQTALSLTDSECTIVNLFNDSEYLNPTASICWGECENIIYMIDGIYDNNSNNHPTTDITIKKIILGMGSNDYSSSGYGVFISGKANNEYNGTCKVLKTYIGSISEPINVVFNPLNNNGTAQGMEFDGDIYIAWGFSGHNFLQIRLHDDDNTYEVIRNFMHYFTDEAGNVTYLEPEMLALNGEQIICGSWSGSHPSILSFDRC